jgi:5-formyltetrahydrofolate cyclo-ligase
VADEKHSLRSIFALSREALDRSLAERLAARIQHRLIESEPYRGAGAVLLYAALGREVATEAILDDALAAGKAVFYPRLTADRKRVEVVALRDRRSLRPGAYGILEPQGEAAAVLPDLERLLICVPGLAFSVAGVRLGRGGGHYDRLLAQLAPPALAVGLAYSFQLLDELPAMEHDRRLDFIVTESALHPARTATPAGVRRGTDKGGTPRWC